MTKGTLLLLVFVCSWAAVSQVNADVKLPAVIGSNMVLQQNAEAAIWGWAEPGESVSVKPAWQADAISTTADQQGKWKVILKTPKASGPFVIEIKGKNIITLQNVMLGEVWICSGQSNMEWPMARIDNSEQEITESNRPSIRIFDVAHKVAVSPEQDCTGSWSVCSPETIKSFSAVGYFFGRKLQKDLKVPVGLIGVNWGGTPAESWTGSQTLLTMPDFAERAEKLQEQKEQPEDFNQNYPSALYNGMLRPVQPFAIRGVIWYQGESNATRAGQYRQLFPKMIENWRNDWGNTQMPFYFVQIAPFKNQPPEIREAQLLTMQSVPNTGMVVTTDIGNPENIHPTNKQDVGKRLALWALAKTYGKKDIVYSGPIYKQMKIEGDKIRLSFDYADGGLVAKDGPLTHFTIAGKDKNFVPAEAVIEGDAVIVSSPQIKEPTSVRFGWSNTPEPNLFNKSMLPASPFRTDIE